MLSLLLYTGLAGVVLGIAVLAWAHGRRPAAAGQGARLLVSASALAIVALCWPPSRHQGGERTMRAGFLPYWSFEEQHVVEIAAPRERVVRALWEVTAAEIRYFDTLTSLRSLSLRRGGSRGNEVTAQPLLPHIIRSGFVLLDHRDDHGEFLLGTCARFWALRPDRCPGVEDAGAFLRFNQPGYAKATLYFGTEEVAPNRTRLTTTTRVEPLDPVSRRRFGAYWRLILPGSALLRRSWLEAVKRRSELEAT